MANAHVRRSRSKFITSIDACPQKLIIKNFQLVLDCINIIMLTFLGAISKGFSGASSFMHGGVRVCSRSAFSLDYLITIRKLQDIFKGINTAL